MTHIHLSVRTALIPCTGLLLFIISGAVAIAQEGPTPPAQIDPAALERMERMAHSVTVSRDTYGVPHVFGPTDASVIFGAAYARAEDRLSPVAHRQTVGRE
jgi:acyl-homoserine lactone acylase PvdQ